MHHDSDETAGRLESVKQYLSNDLEEAFDLRFGGSVAKHTFVDGLSDVDILVVMRPQAEEAPDPKSILNQVANRLAETLPRDVAVSRGRIQ